MGDFFNNWLAAENKTIAAKLALTAALHQPQTGPEELDRLFREVRKRRRASDNLLKKEIERRRLARHTAP